MPVWTMPPDTRAVGTGNPPADMNAVVDALTSALTVNVTSTAYSGGMDPSFSAAQNTAAFQAAVTAATSVSGATPARTVFIPAGTYSLNALPAIAGPVRIIGEGQGPLPMGGGTVISGTTLSVSGQGFTFPFQGYLWAGLEVGNLAISYTGSGDVFHQLNLRAGWFHDLGITITGTGSSAFQTSASVSVLNCEWERVSVTTTNATRTVPMVTLSSNASGSISNNTFWKCLFNNAGLENTQYMIYIDCTAGAGAYHYMESFRDCWFESCYGGAIKSLSGMAVLIDGCTVWDVFSGSGGTVGHSFYYLGAFSGGQGSQQSRIIGCSRNRNGPNGSTTWDIECEASTCGTLIEGYSVRADTASTATHAYFQLNGHPDVQLIGNTSPQGATVNGNSTTVVTSPSYSTTVLGAGASAPSLELTTATGFTPVDAGYLAWNFDPVMINSSTAVTPTGTIWLHRVTLRRAATVTNVLLFLGTLGSGLTSSQNFAGLYNSAGTLIGTSADQTTTWNTGGSTGLKTIALSGGPYALQAGIYWVAVLSNFSTTGPAFGRAVGSSGAYINAGTSAATVRWGSNGTGTSLPGSITPGSNSTSPSVPYWAAVS